MSINFKDVLDFLSKYGIKGTFGILLTMIIYFLLKSTILSKFFNSISEKYIEFFMKKKGKYIMSDVSISDINNHDIFSYIDYWMYSTIPTYQFSSEYRTIIFRKYLVIYLRKHKENILNFINSKDFIDMDDSELWKSLLSLINNIIHDYEKEMLSSNIPQIVIDKMKLKNNDTLSLTINLIESICTNQFYKSENNLLKVYSVLNVMLSILENTIHSSVVVCGSINGALNGMKIEEGGKVYKEPSSSKSA